MTISYKKGNVLDAEGYIMQACNCQGVWGHGVAYQLSLAYPTIYQKHRSESLHVGQVQVIDNIICLMTSKFYGAYVDSPKEILHNTDVALSYLDLAEGTTINLPKINSGLFKVPWKDTEKILEKYNYNWIVWEL